MLPHLLPILAATLETTANWAKTARKNLCIRAFNLVSSSLRATMKPLFMILSPLTSAKSLEAILTFYFSCLTLRECISPKALFVRIWFLSILFWTTNSGSTTITTLFNSNCWIEKDHHFLKVGMRLRYQLCKLNWHLFVKIWNNQWRRCHFSGCR